MRRPTRAGIVAGVSLLLSLLLPVAAAADVDVPPADGWYRWQTTSVATATDACCHTWRNGVVERCVCDLDERQYGMSIDNGMIGDDRMINVYVKIEGGAARKIRALSADCPVNTSTRITDLGIVDVADSIGWLRSQLDSDPDVAEHSVNAIGIHGGDDSLQALIGVIENRSYRTELREHALFWLARSDSDDAFAYLDRLLSRR